MVAGLVQSQIAYAESVNPKGDIVPCWEAFLQNYVNRESWIAWAQTPDHRMLAEDLWPYKKSFWSRFKEEISGVIP